MSRRPTDSDTADDAYLRGLSTLRNGTDAAALDDATRQFEQSRASTQPLRRHMPALCQAEVMRYSYLRGAKSVAAAEKASRKGRATRQQPARCALGASGFCTPPPDSSSPRRGSTGRPSHRTRDLTEAYLGLATALAERNLDAAAEETYQRAIRARPRYWASYDEYGAYLASEGRPADAVAHTGGPGSSRPITPPCRVTSARSISCSATSATPRPRFAAPSRSRLPARAIRTPATMYHFDGRYDDAATMSEKAVKLAPQDHSLCGNLADAYRYSRRRRARTGDLCPGRRACPREPGRQPGRRAYSSAARLLPGAGGTGSGGHHRTGAASTSRMPRPCTSTTTLRLRIWSSVTRMPPCRSYASRAAGYPRYLVRAAPEFRAITNEPRLVELLQEPAP